MTQKAAALTTTSDKTVKKAKRLFFVGLLDLSWRLSVSIIVPILAGAFADRKFDTGSVFTIIGLLIGFALAALVIRGVVIKLNKETR